MSLKKIKCAVFYVYTFNFITHFQFMLPTQNCFNFLSLNGNKCFCFPCYFIRKKYILRAINNAMVINKKTSKI